MRWAVYLFALAVVALQLASWHFVTADDSDMHGLPGGMEELEDEDVDPITPSEVRAIRPAANTVYPYVYMLAEDSCKLRKKFPGVRAFLAEDAPYYPTVETKLVGGAPRLHFFTNKDDYDNFVIDYTLPPERVLEMIEHLTEDPNYYEPKHEHKEVPFSWESTTEDVLEVLANFGVARSDSFHKNKRISLQEGLGDDGAAAAGGNGGSAMLGADLSALAGAEAEAEALGADKTEL
jgi:hypothetical protein